MNKRKITKALLLFAPLLLVVSCAKGAGNNSANKAKIVELEVENAQIEYQLREEFEPASDMKVYAKMLDGNKRELNKNEYSFDLSKFNRQRAGEYPVTIKSNEVDVSVDYTVKVNPLKSFSILIIGNSHSDDTIQWTHEIAKDLGLENVYVADLYIGACSLDIHYDNLLHDKNAYEFRTYKNGAWSTRTNTSIIDAILSIEGAEWDYVCLQERTWQGALNYHWDLLDPYIELLSMYVSPETKFVFNTTWAYTLAYGASEDNALVKYFDSDQMKMYSMSQAAAQKYVTSREDIEVVISGGTAVQNIRSSYLEEKRINRDYTHLTYDFGRFVVGLNLIKTITDVDLSHLTWAPAGVTDLEMKIAVEAVEHCMETRFSVTPSIYTEG